MTTACVSVSRQRFVGEPERKKSVTVPCAPTATKKNLPTFTLHLKRQTRKMGKVIVGLLFTVLPGEAVSPKFPSSSISEDPVEIDDNGQEVALDKEQYEYDKALTADRTYLKFKRRLDVNPEQCFGYSFGGKPLLADTEIAIPSSCGLCGKPRQFEMQLMSPLLYFLHESSDDSQKDVLDNWNWITLLVYTCSKSFYRSFHEKSRIGDWVVAEKNVLVQDEKPLEGPAQLSFFS